MKRLILSTCAIFAAATAMAQPDSLATATAADSVAIQINTNDATPQPDSLSQDDDAEREARGNANTKRGNTDEKWDSWDDWENPQADPGANDATKRPQEKSSSVVFIVNDTLDQKLNELMEQIQTTLEQTNEQFTVEDYREIREAFREMRHTVKELKAEGNDVMVEANYTSPERTEPAKPRKPRFYGHLNSFDVGFNSLSEPGKWMTLPDSARYMDLDESKSLEYSLYPFTYALTFTRHLGLETGLGLRWNTMRFDDHQLRFENAPEALAHYTDTVRVWEKSKMTMWSVVVPLVLEWNIATRGGDEFWVAAGCYATIKCGSKTKMVDGRTKIKERRDFHLSPQQFGLTARVGFENIGVFANYNLSRVFKKNEGPDLSLVTLGLSLNFE